jgi:hypothetical protein
MRPFHDQEKNNEPHPNYRARPKDSERRPPPVGGSTPSDLRQGGQSYAVKRRGARERERERDASATLTRPITDPSRAHDRPTALFPKKTTRTPTLISVATRPSPRIPIKSA